ncbi:helix-turn-helix transcriptional regulator [Rhodopseudomonas sp. BR0C11]|uniref:helix-turn-helix domain-containing protein n=1 Tax=Rhodopseudomonas sp. BR0C11 TaxID=2269370 RepID=UPI001968A4AC|nr:helix-turn-helix transcriptional regulator [Rhodopseudomonas sp. BR0C11]
MTQNAMTPAQCRAARAILKWSMARLAKKSGISSRTIYLFEGSVDGSTGIRDTTISILIETFRIAGVTFVRDDDSVSVRLAANPAHEDPARQASFVFTAAIGGVSAA